MVQDSYLGRIATTISLLKKDSSLIPRAISVFDTVMSKNLYDLRNSTKDTLPLINLFFSYAIKCNMTQAQLVKVFLSLGPKLQGEDVVFTTFNRHLLGAQLKLLMQGRIPETHTDSPMYSEMISSLSSMYIERVLRIAGA